MASFVSWPVSHAFCSWGGELAALGVGEVGRSPSQTYLAFPVLPPPAYVTLGKSVPLLRAPVSSWLNQDHSLPSRSSGSREGRGPMTGSAPVRPPWAVRATKTIIQVI